MESLLLPVTIRRQWNALKLLNHNGEFLNAAEGAEILALAESGSFAFMPVDELGKITQKQFLHEHIQSVLALELVDAEAIRAANFRVAVDCVNSVGGIAIPELLYALGVKEIFKLHCAARQLLSQPRALAWHLTELSSPHAVQKQPWDLP